MSPYPKHSTKQVSPPLKQSDTTQLLVNGKPAVKPLSWVEKKLRDRLGYAGQRYTFLCMDSQGEWLLMGWSGHEDGGTFRTMVEQTYGWSRLTVLDMDKTGVELDVQLSTLPNCTLTSTTLRLICAGVIATAGGCITNPQSPV